ncbi:MAG: hypothetical protein WAP03_21765 [Methylorubrum rhodinum]|uniref:hypothetical protein n=1 Tax=Methylorubrum rhodinum TaxID=29428 RepID=UPI003BAF4480
MPRTPTTDSPAASPPPAHVSRSWLTERARASAAAEGLTDEVLKINAVRLSRPEDTDTAALELRQHFQAARDLADAGLRALDARLGGRADV